MVRTFDHKPAVRVKLARRPTPARVAIGVTREHCVIDFARESELDQLRPRPPKFPLCLGRKRGRTFRQHDPRPRDSVQNFVEESGCDLSRPLSAARWGLVHHGKHSSPESIVVSDNLYLSLNCGFML
jgi:hypothetical protein